MPGHRYQQCTFVTGLPLYSGKMAIHLADFHRRHQIKDMQTVRINQRWWHEVWDASSAHPQARQNISTTRVLEEVFVA